MKRRSLLSGILAAMSFPAIVKVSSLMSLPIIRHSEHRFYELMLLIEREAKYYN